MTRSGDDRTGLAGLRSVGAERRLERRAAREQLRQPQLPKHDLHERAHADQDQPALSVGAAGCVLHEDGERAVVDLRMTVDGRPVCAVEHEAIVRLAH